MTLTMIEDWRSRFANQQAKEIVIKAPPVSLQIMIALESVSEVPSNIEISKDGIITRPKPVAPSRIAVAVSNNFMLFEVNYWSV